MNFKFVGNNNSHEQARATIISFVFPSSPTQWIIFVHLPLLFPGICCPVRRRKVDFSVPLCKRVIGDASGAPSSFSSSSSSRYESWKWLPKTFARFAWLLPAAPALLDTHQRRLNEVADDDGALPDDNPTNHTSSQRF